MAITASIALTPAAAKTLQKVAAVLTINNSAGTAVLVTGVTPYADAGGSNTSQAVSVEVGQPPTGPGENITVPASGALTMEFDVIGMGPQVPTYTTNPFGSPGQGGATIVNLPPLAMPQSSTYDIGATVYTNDGAITIATTATLTVTPTGY